MRAVDVEMVQVLTLLLVRTPLLMWWMRRDERRLGEAQLERAWQPATRDLAAFLIGSLALLVHHARTRRGLAGWALGIGTMLACELGFGLLLQLEESLLVAPR